MGMLCMPCAQLLANPFGEPIRLVDKAVDKHVENKEDCRDFKHKMGTVSARLACAVRTARTVAAIDFIPVPHRSPPHGQNQTGKDNHGNFPSVHDFMEKHHGRRDCPYDAQTGQKAQKAENRWKHTAEDVAGFREDHRPCQRFLNCLSHIRVSYLQWLKEARNSYIVTQVKICGMRKSEPFPRHAC